MGLVVGSVNPSSSLMLRCEDETNLIHIYIYLHFVGTNASDILLNINRKGMMMLVFMNGMTSWKVWLLWTMMRVLSHS